MIGRNSSKELLCQLLHTVFTMPVYDFGLVKCFFPRTGESRTEAHGLGDSRCLQSVYRFC